MKDYEISILKWFRSFSSPALDALFRCITFLGEQYFIIVIIMVAYFLLDKKAGQRIVFAMVATICLNNSIKGLVKYARPFVYDPTLEPAKNAIKGATGYSFPSGHTQNATTAYASLALNIKNKKITIIAIIIILLVGLSRLYLGVHYPKDVLFGFLFGIICSFSTYFTHKRIENNSKKQFLTYLVTLLIFLPFLFVFWTNNYDELILLKDFYVSYSVSMGLVLGMYLEHRFVNFEKSPELKTNIKRLLGCVVTLLIVYVSLKLLFKLSIFPQESNVLKIIFDSIRYFFVGFMSLGIYPIIFKNTLFKKLNN